MDGQNPAPGPARSTNVIGVYYGFKVVQAFVHPQTGLDGEKGASQLMHCIGDMKHSVMELISLTLATARLFTQGGYVLELLL